MIKIQRGYPLEIPQNPSFWDIFEQLIIRPPEAAKILKLALQNLRGIPFKKANLGRRKPCIVYGSAVKYVKYVIDCH